MIQYIVITSAVHTLMFAAVIGVVWRISRKEHTCGNCGHRNVG